MARGRKRQYNPNIPKHIDQDKIPAGMFWDNSGAGRWRMFEDGPDGRRRAPSIAGRDARLSDLHTIAEQRAGVAARGTVQFVHNSFMESTEWAELSGDSHRDYRIHGALACEYPTRTGAPFGTLMVDRLSIPVIQRLVESIAKGRPESRPGAGDAVKGRPSSANHVLRYLRRLFAWGMQHGLCTTNPADGVRAAKERKQNTMPPREAFARLLKYARERGALPLRSRGSCAPYLAPLMELAFMCRMRRGEVVRLTEGDATADGIDVRRLKGSLDNVVRWTPALRAAWALALDARARTLATKRNKDRPVPIRKEDRALFVQADGSPLDTDAVDKAIQKLRRSAQQDGIIPKGMRFSLHGLKHRGITDTAGNRADKQQASGHKSASMMNTYDHEKPIVNPADLPDLDAVGEGENDAEDAELYGDLYGDKEKGATQSA